MLPSIYSAIIIFIHYLQQEPLDTSVSSTTTQGGAGFDRLCEGTAYYSYNLADLANLMAHQVNNIEEEIAKKLGDTITALQIGTGKQIANYCIGKTYISCNNTLFDQNDPSTWDRFNPLDTNTWKKKGISDCWKNHKKEYHGGMVVLCAITRKNVPGNLEEFVLRMKRRLLQRYEGDKRLVNIKPNAGQRARQYHAYAIYIAYAYAEEQEEPKEDEEKEMRKKMKT